MNLRFTLRLLITTLISFHFTNTVTFAQCPSLIWADEFDGTSLNTGDWNVVVGGGGFGNNELQYYTNRSNNLKVENGKLVITALNEPNYNGTNDYTSAKINSAGKHYFKYGRMEAKIKLPRTQGLWPAFWMMPENSEYGGWPASGEIDIMEALGANTYKDFGTIHYGSSVSTHKYIGDTYTGIYDLSSDFHVYAVEWEPDTIKWFLDNHLFFTANPTTIAPDAWPFDKEFYLIFNLAVGGWFGGAPNGTTVFPQTLEVDYVRVYSNPYTLTVEGDERVLENSEKTYSVTNGTAIGYNWSVPSGTTILSGQGTKEITVKWGDTGGDVSVEVTTESCLNFSFSQNVTVIKGGCNLIFNDFELNQFVNAKSSTGTAYNPNSTNPDPSSVNNSSTTAFYTRNTIQYDIIYYKVDLIDDATQYEQGNKAFYLDLYTNAPVGSIINLQLENEARSQSAYPSGRRSVFVGTTSVQNKWERIKFNYNSTPDPNTLATEIDQITILFRPNTYNSYNFYMDNFQSRDIDNCGPITTSIFAANSVENNLKISPNPSNDIIKIKLESKSGNIGQMRLIDVLGVTILNKAIEIKGTEFNESIDVSTLSPGIYMLYIQEGDAVSSQKIIVK